MVLQLRSAGSDLAASAAAWARAPLLPILTVALTVAAEAGGWLGAKGIALDVAASTLLLGFYGTQRRWYVALWGGQPFSIVDVLRTSRAMFSRFLMAGLSVGIPLGGLLVIVALVAASSAGSDQAALVVAGCGVAAALLLDVALTFAIPALVFTTDEPGRAMGIGIAMIRSTWPSCAAYVLAPPITLQAFSFVTVDRLGLSGGLGVGAGAALFGLWWKGATAAYYLRNGPAPEGTASASLGDRPTL